MPGWFYLGLGANLGDPAATLRAALQALPTLHDLAGLAGGRLVAASRLYETAPWPDAGADQPPYLNAAVLLSFSAGPQRLLAALQDIETRLGRVRDPTDRNAARTLDLDILLCGPAGQGIFRAPARPGLPALIIPHPRLHLRLFALRPLIDIDPHLIHPLLGRPLRELAEAAQRTQPEPRQVGEIHIQDGAADLVFAVSAPHS